MMNEPRKVKCFLHIKKNYLRNRYGKYEPQGVGGGGEGLPDFGMKRGVHVSEIGKGARGWGYGKINNRKQRKQLCSFRFRAAAK